jgi:hypothetical protein
MGAESKNPDRASFTIPLQAILSRLFRANALGLYLSCMHPRDVSTSRKRASFVNTFFTRYAQHDRGLWVLSLGVELMTNNQSSKHLHAILGAPVPHDCMLELP